ncbi:MAG: hypothetical protein RLZZ387_2047 [Chloroflexota bacterium]|jgi:hypothetical protein
MRLPSSLLARRVAVAALIGLAAGVLCARYQLQFGRGAGDLGWATRLFVDLVDGVDPYGYSTSLTPMSYPLTAGLATAPLAYLPPEVAAGVFFGLSSALMALGLTRDGAWWRLLTFAALPYWAAMTTVQWAPLLLGVALIPALLPLTLCKPHVGLPIALTRLTWRRALACAAFGLGSLLVMPDWPLRFLGHQADPGQYVPPLITLPLGPLLLVLVARWRDERARFVLALSAVPQRLWYDILLIFLAVRTRRQLLALVACSWLAYIVWYFAPETMRHVSLALIYLPAAAMILLDSPRRADGDQGASGGAMMPAVDRVQ